MRLVSRLLSLGLGLCWAAIACVDPQDISLRGRVDLIVVDATITNLDEPQRIQINRAKADPVTGRFGSLPLAQATVTLVVDSAQVIACAETQPGTYELPAHFQGQVGHAYQLRVSLSDGTRYVSTQQVMPFGPPIDKLTPRFSTTSLPAGLYPAGFRAGYDLYIDTPEPANQRNYYRWDWALYEKQIWCRTCYQGEYVDSVQRDYIQNGVYVSSRQAVEDIRSKLYDELVDEPDEVVSQRIKQALKQHIHQFLKSKQAADPGGQVGVEPLLKQWEERTKAHDGGWMNKQTRALLVELFASQRQYLTQLNKDPRIDEDLIRQQLYQIDLEEERLKLLA